MKINFWLIGAMITSFLFSFLFYYFESFTISDWQIWVIVFPIDFLIGYTFGQVESDLKYK